MTRLLLGLPLLLLLPSPGWAQDDPEPFHVVTAVSHLGLARPTPRAEMLWAGRLEYRPASSRRVVPYAGFSVGKVGETDAGLVFVRPSLRFASHTDHPHGGPAEGFLSLRLGAQWATSSADEKDRIDLTRYEGWGPFVEVGGGIIGSVTDGHRLSLAWVVQWVHVGDDSQLFSGVALELTSFGPSGETGETESASR